MSTLLGAHTKQINAYGRRGRRVVDASKDARPRKVDSVLTVSIFDDIPPAPKWAPIASKMKKRENAPPTKSKTPSPIAVGTQRKKRLSPSLSPLRKKRATRVAQLKGAEARRPGSKAISLPKTNMKPMAVDSNAPLRTPLSQYQVNVPDSPAISTKSKINPAPTKSTFQKQRKPFSPFIDMDIIVLDEEGHTIQQERRVSRTLVEAKSINRGIPQRNQLSNAKPMPQTNFKNESESDDDTPIQSKRPKRLATRPTIISDDSESEDESLLSISIPPVRSVNHQLKLTSIAPSLRTLKKDIAVEVSIPSAPYSICPKYNPEPNEDITSIPQSPRPYAPKTMRYPSVPSPIPRPRQLTPIKGGRRHLFELPSPPSPSTPTDFDLSLEFEELNLDSGTDGYTSAQPHMVFPDYLEPLLEECHQQSCGPYEFSAFIESFRYDPIFQSSATDNMDMTFRKIGEASYSEVFGIGDVVLKVVPLRDETINDSPFTYDKSHKNTKNPLLSESDDTPAPSDAKDVRKEIIVTRAMGEVDDKFVKLLKTYIVRGRYPEVLLRLWDEYNETKGSESVRPDTFTVSQLYAIIVLPNGGPDLEAYRFSTAHKVGWRQACSLFWQVAKALGHAEQLVSFEHRDLHWGQILVKNLPNLISPPLKDLNVNQKTFPNTRSLFMDDISHGIQVTLIDLGLSRMDAGDGSGGVEVHWTPFDDEVFMGEGDYQFDIYRMMREHTTGDWKQFHPLTNVMWLHYLTIKLLFSKGLKPPAAPRKINKDTQPPSIKPKTVAFSERDCYDCLVDIEDWLSKCLAPTKTKNRGKGRRKTSVLVQASPTLSPACVAEIVEYGLKRGWIGTSS